jgi:hypothetical protein
LRDNANQRALEWLAHNASLLASPAAQALRNATTVAPVIIQEPVTVLTPAPLIVPEYLIVPPPSPAPRLNLHLNFGNSWGSSRPSFRPAPPPPSHHHPAPSPFGPQPGRQRR